MNKVTAILLPNSWIKGSAADDTIDTIGGGRNQGVVGALLPLGIDQGDGDGGYGDDGDTGSYVLFGDGAHG